MNVLDFIPGLRQHLDARPEAAFGDGAGGPSAFSEASIEDQIAILGIGGRKRTEALQVVAFHRSVSLISSTVAELISQTLHVVDRKRRTINPQPDSLLDLLTSTPDGVTSAYNFWEDTLLDMLLEGNGLIAIDRNADGRVVRLWRLIAKETKIEERKGRLIYTGPLAGPSAPQGERSFTLRNVIHARAPDYKGDDTVLKNQRSGFTRPVSDFIRPDIRITGEISKWLLRYFDAKGGALKSDLAIAFEGKPPADAQAALLDAIKGYMQKRLPLAIWNNPKFTPLNQTPQNADTSALRSQQVTSIARAFGIPAPLIGENVTQWGSGISELARLYWKFGARQHLTRLLQSASIRLLKQKSHHFAVNEMEIFRGDLEGLTDLINATKGDQQRPIVGFEEIRRWIGQDDDAPESVSGYAPPSKDGGGAGAAAGDGADSARDRKRKRKQKKNVDTG